MGRMVDMQMNNEKLRDRASKIVATTVNVSLEQAEKLLVQYGSARAAIDNVEK